MYNLSKEEKVLIREIEKQSDLVRTWNALPGALGRAMERLDIQYINVASMKRIF